MNYENIETYLKEVGERERDELRSLVTNPVIDYPTRSYAWHLMDELSIFLSGFLYCIAVAGSEEKAEHYKKFFDQARSENGLDGEVHE